MLSEQLPKRQLTHPLLRTLAPACPPVPDPKTLRPSTHHPPTFPNPEPTTQPRWPKVSRLIRSVWSADSEMVTFGLAKITSRKHVKTDVCVQWQRPSLDKINFRNYFACCGFPMRIFMTQAEVFSMRWPFNVVVNPPGRGSNLEGPGHPNHQCFPSTSQVLAILVLSSLPNGIQEFRKLIMSMIDCSLLC